MVSSSNAKRFSLMQSTMGSTSCPSISASRAAHICSFLLQKNKESFDLPHTPEFVISYVYMASPNCLHPILSLRHLYVMQYFAYRFALAVNSCDFFSLFNAIQMFTRSFKTKKNISSSVSILRSIGESENLVEDGRACNAHKYIFLQSDL